MENDQTIIRDGDSSTAGMVAIVLIAAVLIIGFLLFMMRAFPFNQVGSETDVDVGTQEENFLPDADVSVPYVEPPVTPAD